MMILLIPSFISNEGDLQIIRVIPEEMAISRYFLTNKLANFDINFKHVATPRADLKLTMSILRRM